MVALEPNYEAFRFLRKFASEGFHCLPLAAGDEDHKRLLINVKSYRQSSSTAFLKSKDTSSYEGQASCTADSLMANLGIPTFIKIDVERAELNVLKGITKLLLTVPYVLVEINLDNICRKFGYLSYDIYDLMEKNDYLFYYDVCNANNSVTLMKSRKSTDVLFSRHSLDWVSA